MPGIFGPGGRPRGRPKEGRFNDGFGIGKTVDGVGRTGACKDTFFVQANTGKNILYVFTETKTGLQEPLENMEGIEGTGEKQITKLHTFVVYTAPLGVGV